jgi:serine/threonine protein kinase
VQSGITEIKHFGIVQFTLQEEKIFFVKKLFEKISTKNKHDFKAMSFNDNSSFTKPHTTSSQVIGKGTFGEVELEGNLVHKRCFLIKKKQTQHMIVDNVLRELIFYSMLSASPEVANITHLITRFPSLPPASIPRAQVSILNEVEVCLTMPYLGLTLNKFLVNKTNKQLLGHVFGQLLEALCWLHQRQWSHGDLKPSNVLIDPVTHNVSLIDYGSVFFTSKFKLAYQRCTLFYVAPEELLSGVANGKCDIWSFGAVLFEIYTGKIFVLGLMQFMEIPGASINLFTKHSNQASQSFDSKDFLTQFFSKLMYCNIIEYLTKCVKDRDILSVLAHCLSIDTTLRFSAQRLMKTEHLFYAYFTSLCQQYEETEATQELNHCFEETIDIQALIEETQVDELNQSARVFKSFEEVRHLNISMSDRKQTILKLIDVIEISKDLGEDVLMHSLMLFDRILFTFFQPDNKFKALSLVFACVLSGMLFKGSLVTLENIKRIMTVKITEFELCLFLQTLLKKLDFMLFTYSPDLIFHLIQQHTPSLNAGEREYTDMLSIAFKYPWLPTNIWWVTQLLYQIGPLGSEGLTGAGGKDTHLQPVDKLSNIISSGQTGASKCSL